MSVFVPDLHKNATRLSEQSRANDEAVAKITEIRMNPKLPRVAKCFDLFRLSRSVLNLSVFDVALGGPNLPFEPNLIPYGGSK